MKMKKRRDKKVGEKVGTPTNIPDLRVMYVPTSRNVDLDRLSMQIHVEQGSQYAVLLGPFQFCSVVSEFLGEAEGLIPEGARKISCPFVESRVTNETCC